MLKCELQDFGRIGYQEAFDLQRELVDRRKRGLIPDQFLIVEHPHVVTMGRNGKDANLLASPEVLERAGIEFHPTDRGGDVTYHGPGQIVGYPIIDLREWKRDVVAYVRAIEQVLIEPRRIERIPPPPVRQRQQCRLADVSPRDGGPPVPGRVRHRRTRGDDVGPHPVDLEGGADLGDLGEHRVERDAERRSGFCGL